ncbi:MAG: PKD domain-containing protein [Bacteroidia bacterium]|nr:PKD domain-containing protein [Bacteroidia bacterium]
MKYTFSLFTLLFLILSAYSQAGLVAHYPFDGNCLDQSGNFNHGTLFGGTYATDRFGNPNGAVELDGINDFVQFIDSNNLQAPLPITVSAWVELYDSDPNVAFRNNYNDDSYHGVWMVIVSSGRLACGYGDGGFIGPSWRRSKLGTTTLALNTWIHLAIVIRGPLDMDLYVNGINDCGTYNGNGGSLAYSGNIGTAGKHDSFNGLGGYEFFNGKIDDLRMYNRALSAGEIRQLAGVRTFTDTTICQGDTIQLPALNGNLVSWNNTPGLSCYNCPSPLASPTTNSTYIRTINNLGCINRDTVQVNVQNCFLSCEELNIQSQFTYNFNNLYLEALDTSTGLVDSISWDMGNGVVIPGIPGDSLKYTYPSAGVYPFCVYSYGFKADTICGDTFCVQLKASRYNCSFHQLNDYFTDSIKGLTVSLEMQSTTSTIDWVEWDFGDGNFLLTAPGTNPSHTYNAPGTYQVCMTVFDSINVETTCTSTYCDSVSIPEIGGVNNEALLETHIDFTHFADLQLLSLESTLTEQVEIGIIDLRGKQLYKGLISPGRNQLSTHQWAKGIYIIQFRKGAYLWSKKILKY